MSAVADPALHEARVIAQCIESFGSVAALRATLPHLDKFHSDRAQFARALFTVELARHHDRDAATAMSSAAATLLRAWRTKSGDSLAGDDEVLKALWLETSSLVALYEVDNFKKALSACWKSRTDLVALGAAVHTLAPAGNRRVEFAACLYHLELARLGVDSSRSAFAQRVDLIRQAYLSKDTADDLIGDDVGLKHLWLELIPYLDEFFESIETTDDFEELDAPPPQAPPAPPTATVTAATTPSAEHNRETRRIPSFDQLAPQLANAGAVPPTKPQADLDFEVVVDADIIAPAALEYLTDVEPTDEQLQFWRWAEKVLDLVPNSAAPRLDARVLSADGRNERKKLQRFIDGVTPRFAQVPEAQTLSCLLRLYMASQLKEKSLFGQPNQKRKDALAQALPLMTSTAMAAGHAAVWFELDGAQTASHLQDALDIAWDYVAFCSRKRLDPLDATSATLFTATSLI